MDTKYKEPDQLEFDNAVSVVADIITKTAVDATRKAGSAIHELIIRPASYIFSWISKNVDGAINSISIANLKESQATVNPVADLIASNYFVERKAGVRAKGVITITMNKAVAHIASGSRFSVGGSQVATTTQIVATNVQMSSTYEDVLYVTAVPFGQGQYIANIPVTVVDAGAVEIPPGSVVEVLFPNGFIEKAELTSAISGGAGTETDAELFKRAEYNTAASGIGTFFGIKKKLSECPVYVEDLSVVAGEDAAIHRSRYNTLNINPGGFVDVYVKTQKQPAVSSIPATAVRDASGVFTADLSLGMVAGLYRVVSVVAFGEYVDNFSVTFTADRLSAKQLTSISFVNTDTEDESVQISAYVEYMPGISDIQGFMDREENTFIGQNTQIKAAVPVLVSMDCAVYSADGVSDERKAELKALIASYINSIPVGARNINFSDIREACELTMPDISLRLPCTISAETVLKDGTSDTFYSDTGILDISDTANTANWDYRLCFFSITEDRIRIGAS